MKRISIAIIVCSSTVGLSAFAAEPTPAEQHLARAEALKQAGGWAFKTGAVDRELAETRRLSAATTVAAPPSAEAQDHLARAEALKQAGGWAFKTGAVDRELALAAKAEEATAPAAAPPSGCPMHLASAAEHRDRAQALAQGGGWAYKNGAIDRELGAASLQTARAASCEHTGGQGHPCDRACAFNN